MLLKQGYLISKPFTIISYLKIESHIQLIITYAYYAELHVSTLLFYYKI